MKRLTAFLPLMAFFLLVAQGSEARLTPQRSVLLNGLVLLTSEQRALPMVTLQLLIKAGSRFDPRGNEGLANLTSRLLTYGTQKQTALQISETLDFIGANLSAGCSEDMASVSLTILKKDLVTGLELLAEILTESVFAQKEIARQKQAIIASIKAKEEDPGNIAQLKFYAALYPNSPYGRAVEGTADSVQGLERSAMVDFYDRYYRPNRSIVAVVGDVSHQEMEKALNRAFRSWKKSSLASEAAPVVASSGSGETIRVEKDLTQANIIIGHDGVPRDHPDHYAIQIMNYVLGGGGFSSRLMDSIRNERGLAYSVYSHFSAEKYVGTFQIVMQTKNETAGEAIQIAKGEIRRIREKGISEEELSAAKDYLTGSFPLRLDTNRRVASFLAHVEFFELGLDYTNLYPDLIRKVRSQDILRVARQYLHPDKLIVVIVANQKQLGESR